MPRFLALILATIFALACSAGGDDPAAGAAISGDALAKRLAAGTAPVVLDVRSEAEFRAGHIPGAVHVPHDQLADRIAELPPGAKDEVVVHCKRGGRAAKAEAVLAEAGYTNVRDLDGHWEAWQAAGHPTTTDAAH